MKATEIDRFVETLGHDCCQCDQLAEDSPHSECEYCSTLSMLIRAKVSLEYFEGFASPPKRRGRPQPAEG